MLCLTPKNLKLGCVFVTQVLINSCFLTWIKIRIFLQLTPIEKYALNYLEFFHISTEERERKENEVQYIWFNTEYSSFLAHW